MFTEPQTVTTNAVADNLPRVSFDPEGVFHNATTGRKLRIAHQRGKRSRDTVRLDITKTAVDPLLDGVSRQYSMSVYLVIDAPIVGFSTTEVGYHAQALVDWTDLAGNLTKVINGES
jgi:hypothetical protein